MQELIDAAEAIVNRGGRQMPNLMPIGHKTKATVGKVSEMNKGLAGKTGQTFDLDGASGGIT